MTEQGGTVEVDISKLTPEQRQQLLAELAAQQNQDAVKEAEKRAERRINKTLRSRLIEIGVNQGDPWKAPGGVTCAYPAGWRVEHGGVVWAASVTAATDEPSENSDQWIYYDRPVEGDENGEKTEEDLLGEQEPGDVSPEPGEVEEPEEPEEPEGEVGGGHD